MSFALHHADCFDVFPSIPDQSIDMVLADLPYGTTNCAWDSHLPLADLWSQYNRICRGPVVLFAQTGVACINTGRRFIGIEKDPAYFATASARINALQEPA